MGLGDFVKGVGDAVENTAKLGGAIAEHTLNPTKWDNAARFIGDHGDDIAKVGWDIAKDQINPMKADFWLNAGTLALSAATGGAAAAPLMAARAGMAARTANTVAKGVSAADKIGDAARVVDKVGDATRAMSKTEKFVDAALTSKSATAAMKTREAAGLNPLSKVAQGRVGLANKVMAGGGETPGLMRTMTSTAIAGQKGIKPSARIGTAASHAGNFSDDLWRGQRIARRANQVQGAGTYVDVMKDPTKAATDAVLGDGGDSQPATSTRPGQRQQSTVGSGNYADNAALTTSQAAPADTMRVGYANQYSPRGYTSPSASPVRGSTERVGEPTLTTSATYNVRDPYQNTNGESQTPGQPYKVRDPYKPLTQPKGY